MQIGLLRELNPGPLAPEARIMPLDQAASWQRHEPAIWYIFVDDIQLGHSWHKRVVHIGSGVHQVKYDRVNSWECIGPESLCVSSFGIEFANDRAAKQSHKINGTCSDHTRPQARGKKQKADSTLRSSQAVPHPSTGRALCRLTSEVRRDPVHSTRYGRQRWW